MCSLTFAWSVCPLSRPLIANTHVQLDKQEVSKGWISREAESIFITLYLTLIKMCYCPFKESCSEIVIKNKHTHSFPDFILSMTCLGCYVYGACTRLKAEDINHKKLTFWFAIMHALQPVGQIFFFSFCPLNWRGGGKRQRGGVMWCHQISWLSPFVRCRTITRCPADVNVPQSCPRHLLEGERGSKVLAAQGALGIFYLSIEMWFGLPGFC